MFFVLFFSGVKGRYGFFGLAAVFEAGGPAQIHLPLPGDDARGCFTWRIQSCYFKTTCCSTAPRLHPRPGTYRSVTAVAFEHNQLAVDEMCWCVPLLFPVRQMFSVHVSYQSWSTVGGN